MRKPLALAQLGLLGAKDLVEVLRSRHEDQWLERKSARIRGKDLGQFLVGFANAEGGIVAIGIYDRKVEGVSGASSRINEWRQAAIDFTEPPVRHKFELVECTNTRGTPDQVAVIEVEASERVHTDHRGDTYLRVGDENRKLDSLQVQELRFDKGDSIYDGTVVTGFDSSDLDARLVDRYLSQIRARSQDALRARGLVALRNGTAYPTVAGLLILGREPQRAFPQAMVRLLRYEGSSRETGARSNVAHDRRLQGTLAAQIDGARRALRRWLPTAIRLQPEGRFQEATLIPSFAWLEAIVNAVTHRSYSLAGDHVRVEVFNDRLEVHSPGRLPGLVRLETIRSTRFARNPRIARAMNDLGYGRELGEGVNRMFEEMERAGLPDPIYAQGAASVAVTLLADPLAGRVLRQLPPGSERFVELLTRRGVVTSSEASRLLGVSRPTALGHLRRLASLGLIEHAGTSPNDPRGYWRLRRSGE